MCTAATYRTRDFYFGRNLDYEFPYGECVAIAPRNFPFPMRETDDLTQHYTIIGMAHVQDGYPLYYDAMNEKGLCIAGLNFVGNAVYRKSNPACENLAQFELIPALLGRCASVAEARAMLARVNLTDTPFSDGLPLAQLHWLIADRTACIVLESVADGIHIYDNPTGVLTNNPPFPAQLFALNNYAHVSPKPPVNRFAPDLPLAVYSRGMGALGLPGDLSSQSRFVRAAFTRLNSRSGESESESVSQFFHILASVEQQRGCCELENGKFELTLYSSCCNADRGIYYYTTYENSQITGIDLHRENLDGAILVSYPLIEGQQIRWMN